MGHPNYCATQHAAGLNPTMPAGLKRYQTSGHNHAINFCCYHHLPYLNTQESRDIFEHSLEQARRKYNFAILAYVVMPDHVHLLVSEPPVQPLSKAIQSFKLSVSKQLPSGHSGKSGITTSMSSPCPRSSRS